MKPLAGTSMRALIPGQPRETHTVNFYPVRGQVERYDERSHFYRADLPGYGYARTAKKNRKIWSHFIEAYLLQSEDLQFVCQLMDIRHEPMASDIEMFQWLVVKGLPVLVLATKADKLSRNEQTKSIAA